MLFDFLFKEKHRRAELLAQAEAKVQILARRRDALDEAKTLKLKRQSELWMILNLDSQSEEEYFTVSRVITDLVKEIAAIDEYLEDLRGAGQTCRESKDCAVVEQLLKIEDPWAEKIKLGTQDALPRTPLKIN